MSIWGKISGAAAGFFMSGPLGAVAGAMAGHLLFDREPPPDIAFTMAMVALAGKMARADGTVSDREIEIFRGIFQVPPGEEANVKRLFDLARQDVAGYEIYAFKIAKLFRGRPALLEDVLDGLFEIAKADGQLHPEEARFLEKVAEIFGFAPNEYRRIRASHFGHDNADPYGVLGVAYDATEKEIQLTYYRLVRENHPDSMMGRGVPPEFVKLATEKLAAINAAYEKIREERGLI
jgi:DnaJ like chaperone protein